MSTIRLCKCGCGQPVKEYLNPSGKSARRRSMYAADHGVRSSAGASRVPENPIDLAYMAGIVDGEGCIYGFCRMRGRKVNTIVRLSILMCSASVPQWVHANFGGSFYALPKREGRPDRFLWQIACSHVGPVLTALLPYLKEKRAQAEIALKLVDVLTAWGGGNMKKISDESFQERVALCVELKRLKRTWKEAA